LLTYISLQAASGIEGLKVGESPAKKLQFQAAGKENVRFDADAPVVEVEVKKPVEEVNVEKAIVVAPTIKPEEADEPLLQENPQRFVLFPIKYHEVSIASSTRPTRKVFCD
jgi:ribonucleoside-diphosphate reductase subunit M2